MNDNGRDWDRRSVFFIGAALTSFALMAVADDKFVWVARDVGIVYLVLALVSALDHRSRRRQ